MSMDTKSYRLTVLNVLIAAIRTKNDSAIVAVRAKALAILGYEVYTSLYSKAYTIVNTQPYKFTDFSAKVNTDSVDRVISGEIAPRHNED